jgi:hypothetical protein
VDGVGSSADGAEDVVEGALGGGSHGVYFPRAFLRTWTWGSMALCFAASSAGVPVALCAQS